MAISLGIYPTFSDIPIYQKWLATSWYIYIYITSGIYIYIVYIMHDFAMNPWIHDDSPFFPRYSGDEGLESNFTEERLAELRDAGIPQMDGLAHLGHGKNGKTRRKNGEKWGKSWEKLGKSWEKWWKMVISIEFFSWFICFYEPISWEFHGKDGE